MRRPPRSTPKPSSAASDVYKRQSVYRMQDVACIYLFLLSLIQAWNFLNAPLGSTVTFTASICLHPRSCWARRRLLVCIYIWPHPGQFLFQHAVYCVYNWLCMLSVIIWICPDNFGDLLLIEIVQTIDFVWRLSVEWNCPDNWFGRLAIYWNCPDNWFRWLFIK